MIESSRYLRKLETSEELRYKKVLDVPIVKQEHGNWCGYASLNMLLRYRGISITNEELFFRAYPELRDKPDLDLKKVHLYNGPSFVHLAALATEILGDEYNVKLLFKSKYKDVDHKTYLQKGTYDDYEKKNPKFTPMFLLDTFLKSENPAMLRFHNHTVVATGMGIKEDGDHVYRFNSPLAKRPQWSSESILHNVWSMDDEKQTITDIYHQENIAPIMSSSYLMLTIFPKRA